MSASSCGSGESGGTRALGADIIDLDRYMRSAVKPHRNHRVCEQLVVDAGGVQRVPRPPRTPSSDSSVPPAPPAPRARLKRPSHDSGVSDSSYVRRRHRTHKHYPEQQQQQQQQPPQPSPSVLQFRLTCEQALRDQQQQIERVARLCERLAQPAAARAAPASASSDVSSSSSSRQDTRREESCRTYKIIMSKLDELSRLFAARPRASPHVPRAPRAARASSRSVSVRDQLVATEPPPSPRLQTVVVARCERARLPADGSTPLQDARSQDSEGHRERSAPDAYDLDDPIHLYEQAKRLQPPRAARAPQDREALQVVRACAVSDKSAGGESLPTDERLCAACRATWRALCRRLPLLFAPRSAD